MREPLINKTNLLARLNNIYKRLEKLDVVLRSSCLQQRRNVRTIQKNRIDSCKVRMADLENEAIKQLEERNNKKQSISNQYKIITSFQLE